MPYPAIVWDAVGQGPSNLKVSVKLAGFQQGVKDLIDHIRAWKGVGKIPNQRLHDAANVGTNPR